MKKAIAQFLIFVVLFLAGWGLFSLVDWRGLLNWEDRSERIEEKLGSVVWEAIQQQETVVDDEEIHGPVDTLLTRIAKENQIKREDIRLHIIRRDEVNAFALPDGHIGVFTGMISEAESEEELAGVLAHELAHVDHNHVMDKLTREIGMSVLVSIATGGAGAETVATVVQMLTSSAFSRSMEEEADEYAVRYMLEASINPEPFSELMYRLRDKHQDLPEQFRWFSTHPDPESRAIAIVDHIPDEQPEYESILDQDVWENLQDKVAD